MAYLFFFSHTPMQLVVPIAVRAAVTMLAILKNVILIEIKYQYSQFNYIFAIVFNSIIN